MQRACHFHAKNVKVVLPARANPVAQASACGVWCLQLRNPTGLSLCHMSHFHIVRGTREV